MEALSEQCTCTNGGATCPSCQDIMFINACRPRLGEQLEMNDKEAMRNPQKPTHVDLGVGTVDIRSVRTITMEGWLHNGSSKAWLEVTFRGIKATLTFPSVEARDAAYLKLTTAMRVRGMIGPPVATVGT